MRPARESMATRVARFSALWSCSLVLLVACSGGSDGKLPPVSVEPTDEVPVTPARPASREWRRMDIDQLKASIARVSGGIRWIENDATGQPFDVLDSLAGSLGKPDFLNSNTEDLEPGLLFQKFLDDAASAVCTSWVAREQQQARSQRLLVSQAEFSDTPTSAPAAIEANMRALLLRFHGMSVGPGDATLTPWLGLFQKVWQGQGSTSAAWRTVCIALFIHPDFYTF